MADSAILKTKPWEAEPAPKEIYEPKGMVGPEERRCYFWLGKYWLSGQGCVVDAGAFLGASTLCFAAGAAAGGRRQFEDSALVHAFDYFEAMDAYIVEAIAKDFRPIAHGENYLDIFAAQTAAYADMICVHPGDFLTHRWSGPPTEVLFIDIAKTPELSSHVVAEFFPSLVPGRSVVVHQDYHHCWHPYIHIGMEYLDEEFELVDEHVAHQSRLWRLVRPIPIEKIKRLAAYDFTQGERMDLLDRLVLKAPASSRPMTEIVRLWQRCLDGDFERARLEFTRLDEAYRFGRRYELWAQQALEVKAAMGPHANET